MKLKHLNIATGFIAGMFFLTATAIAQETRTTKNLQLLGTRSWIRVNWEQQPGVATYRLYWSAGSKKPATPNAVVNAGTGRFYIQKVQEETTYHVWLEPVMNGTAKRFITGTVKTGKQWAPDPEEIKELQTNPSSVVVPRGMQIFWQDEFNDTLLNQNKWTTNYFSSFNYMDEISRKEMLENKLPQPAYTLNGKTINLFVNDSLPARLYTPKGNQKISSIQTYDWRTNENLLDNSRGGYFEVKVRRSKTGNPRGTNTAFWFDSPGPDLQYYLERGSEVDGVKGIRPPGQVFEIDVFEMLNAQFVLHGQVDKNGKFIHNLATHIAQGFQHENNWVTHGVLWTPTSVKHYINGQLIHEYTDKHKIYSPNHFMNVFLGTYGSGGGVNMEVDYIRYYTWPLKDGNELPNSGFEDSGTLAPWEGTGTLSSVAKRTGRYGVVLQPGEMIEQYVYLSNNRNYELGFWCNGKSTVNVSIDDLTPVTGRLTNIVTKTIQGGAGFSGHSIHFNTGKDEPRNMKTIHLQFTNTGKARVALDDITVKK